MQINASSVRNLKIPILLNRTRNRIRLKIGQELYGFVKDTEMRNTIFIIKIISERAT